MFLNFYRFELNKSGNKFVGGWGGGGGHLSVKTMAIIIEAGKFRIEDRCDAS